MKGRTGTILGVCLLMQAPGSAFAQTDARAWRVYVAAGGSVDSESLTRSLGVGGLVSSALFDSVKRRAGPLTLHWDLFLNHWYTPEPGERRRSFTQIGGLGAWRHRLGGAGSRWFTTVGVGVSLLDRRFATPTRRFSTTFQFTEALAIGFQFGERHDREFSLRFQHFSDGGIKEPNPGLNFVLARLALPL
ncbi:MAG: acyloxyacyl hydrolase [Gammaproteobacteria bacterium]|nr:acyloxyacyl hydrolase [Gammaproteobacteria bacterium]